MNHQSHQRIKKNVPFIIVIELQGGDFINQLVLYIVKMKKGYISDEPVCK